jgi:hypothetical protein
VPPTATGLSRGALAPQEGISHALVRRGAGRGPWAVADQLGWSATFDAEHVAFTLLPADVLLTTDPEPAPRVGGAVQTATVDVLTRAEGGSRPGTPHRGG